MSLELRVRVLANGVSSLRTVPHSHFHGNLLDLKSDSRFLSSKDESLNKNTYHEQSK